MVIAAINASLSFTPSISKQAIEGLKPEYHSLRTTINTWFEPIAPKITIAPEDLDIVADDSELGPTGYLKSYSKLAMPTDDSYNNFLQSISRIFKNLDLLFKLQDPAAPLTPTYSAWERQHRDPSKSKGEYLIYHACFNVLNVVDYITKSKNRSPGIPIQDIRNLCNFILNKLLAFLDPEFIPRLGDRIEERHRYAVSLLAKAEKMKG